MSERVGDALVHVLLALDVVAEIAMRPDGYDEVAAEEVRLGEIVSRALLILSLIQAEESAPVGRVQ